MKKIISLFLLCLLLLLSCITTHFASAEYEKVYPFRTPADQIAVYRTQIPEKKFIEIGMVNASGYFDVNVLLMHLRQNASENGGDALIRLEVYPSGILATVIRFLD